MAIDNRTERQKYIQDFFASLTADELREISNELLPNADVEVVKEYVIESGILTIADIVKGKVGVIYTGPYDD